MKHQTIFGGAKMKMNSVCLLSVLMLTSISAAQSNLKSEPAPAIVQPTAPISEPVSPSTVSPTSPMPPVSSVVEPGVVNADYGYYQPSSIPMPPTTPACGCQNSVTESYPFARELWSNYSGNRGYSYGNYWNRSYRRPWSIRRYSGCYGY